MGNRLIFRYYAGTFSATIGLFLTFLDNLTTIVFVVKQDNAVEYRNGEKQHKL
jgi:hypothetical protein